MSPEQTGIIAVPELEVASRKRDASRVSVRLNGFAARSPRFCGPDGQLRLSTFSRPEAYSLNIPSERGPLAMGARPDPQPRWVWDHLRLQPRPRTCAQGGVVTRVGGSHPRPGYPRRSGPAQIGRAL